MKAASQGYWVGAVVQTGGNTKRQLPKRGRYMANLPPQRDTRNKLYQLILDEDIEAFNTRCTGEDCCDFKNLDFRSQDLRQFKVEGIDFSGCYFRQADLRGLDLSTCRLEGASIHGAKISGVYFPPELSPEEIRLSLDYGTRLRYGKY
jgi:uncharacterized protein YjbI with pentapeptide repeats